MTSKSNATAFVDSLNLGTDSTKRCFVTVGATASFTQLIRAVLESAFLDALHAQGYTELRIQYGKDGKMAYEECSEAVAEHVNTRTDITITGFDFDRNGLVHDMLMAKREFTTSRLKGKEGCVVSHAGSGSILEAMRVQVPLIVVPNTDLLHNHQKELAEELAELNYVVHGRLEKLSEALPQLEQLRHQMNAWPPSANKSGPSPGQALASVIDDELGWVD